MLRSKFRDIIENLFDVKTENLLEIEPEVVTPGFPKIMRFKIPQNRTYLYL